MELIAAAHEQYRRGRGLLVIDVDFLAVAPGRFRNGVGVGAAFDGVGDFVTEASADFFENGRTALILHGVMQQRGDGLVLVGAEFQRERSDSDQVRDVGDVRTFAALCGVQPAGVDESVVEALR